MASSFETHSCGVLLQDEVGLCRRGMSAAANDARPRSEIVNLRPGLRGRGFSLPVRPSGMHSGNAAMRRASGA
ncbi:hypothetical protein A33M_3787 [Rhodovulum sp. PH10]|nr:hypothetical protein A33M_3787 [Rhodovulum sp. PH10]